MATSMSSATVHQKLSRQASSPPTFRACLQSIALLSEPERKVLVESAAKYHLSPADEEAFTTAAVQALASDDLDGELGDAANGASAAVNGIIELMVALVLNLAWADTMNGTNLTDQYEPIMRLYCQTMKDGIPLSNTIAQYAEDFDNKVIAFCADTSLTTDQRLSQIQEYIKDAEASQTTAQDMQNTLNSVFDKTMDFINMVNSDSLKKEATEKTFPVPKSAKKLADVSPKLEIPALTAAFDSPFGPYVTIAGLLGIHSTEATNTAYAIAAAMSNRERVPMSKVLKDLATQDGADDTNTEYFNEFREHIGVLAGYWGSTLIDARQIEAWLKDGAAVADMPKYMEIALNGGVKIYVKVAKYLRSYAEQTNQIPWDEWLSADDA
ncbi:hypothetical protein P170DRAFT_392255 [Aspergillus steynii IBT 23096]|uniref:Uncharacterized protein n=1 Tax=Aspergillus steynii IBT 23096 TaxID=1392250 RepID=A0A2I2FU74_9EURO|nr:uncharacterized protein P170DRAFT_392255 [Aspergillus steynii IBT 23096]PLB44182.1 hypothetical protein P170DRAFT_392255 [Aspergillus steynii IBT 23096]